ncbi:hypothetical protein AQUCO_00100826v1 [Aquilegia coerulea]|uniref:Uncharacterized protein n=1 Tax=Aquilegia coerulea TaxID=218851 RepID=A0A2G5FCA8_AQUCA|nr:hypothetical protein AQUCO_00100826v1 [Aquilegia coerulea]
MLLVGRHVYYNMSVIIWMAQSMLISLSPERSELLRTWTYLFLMGAQSLVVAKSCTQAEQDSIACKRSPDISFLVNSSERPNLTY